MHGFIWKFLEDNLIASMCPQLWILALDGHTDIIFFSDLLPGMSSPQIKFSAQFLLTYAILSQSQLFPGWLSGKKFLSKFPLHSSRFRSSLSISQCFWKQGFFFHTKGFLHPNLIESSHVQCFFYLFVVQQHLLENFHLSKFFMSLLFITSEIV